MVQVTIFTFYSQHSISNNIVLQGFIADIYMSSIIGFDNQIYPQLAHLSSPSYRYKQITNSLCYKI
jgi:hypothetical protein